jgi:hypothetical protein
METERLTDFFTKIGMASGELTISYAWELVSITEEWKNTPISVVYASFARAAGYCYGEYLANYYETPYKDRPKIENPPSYYKEKFDLEMNR